MIDFFVLSPTNNLKLTKLPPLTEKEFDGLVTYGYELLNLKKRCSDSLTTGIDPDNTDIGSFRSIAL